MSYRIDPIKSNYNLTFGFYNTKAKGRQKKLVSRKERNSNSLVRLTVYTYIKQLSPSTHRTSLTQPS